MVKEGFSFPFRSAAADADLIILTPDGSDGSGWLETFKSEPAYAWINAAIDSYRAKEEVGEVNPEVKRLLWREQTVHWTKINSTSLATTEQATYAINAQLFEKACPDNALRLRLQIWLQEEVQRASMEAEDELERLLMNEREAGLLTLNPRKDERKLSISNDRVQAIAKKYEIQVPAAALPQAAMPPSNVSYISGDIVIRSLIVGAAELFYIFDTHDSLAAYYDVALYCFIDNSALQVVERHLLGPRGPLRLFNSEYVTQKLYGPENERELNAMASENPTTAQRCADFETEMTTLDKILSILVRDAPNIECALCNFLTPK